MANGNGQLGAVARGSQLAGGINGSPRVNALRAYANLQAKQRAAQAKLANVAQKRRLATPQLGAAPRRTCDAPWGVSSSCGPSGVTVFPSGPTGCSAVSGGA